MYSTNSSRDSERMHDRPDRPGRSTWPRRQDRYPTTPVFSCPVKGCGAASSAGRCPRGH